MKIHINMQEKPSLCIKVAVRKYSLVKVQYHFDKSSKQILDLALFNK